MGITGRKLIFGILIACVFLALSFSVLSDAKAIKVVSKKKVSSPIVTPMGRPSGGQYVMVSTVPNSTNVTADGKTEYRVDVVIDTTNAPGVKFRWAWWTLVIPVGVNITRSEWPSQPSNPSTDTRDFFYNFNMSNKTDSATCYGVGINWTSNGLFSCRTVKLVNGPSNAVNKILGSFYFIVNSSASSLGNRTFGIYDYRSQDTSSVDYKCPADENDSYYGCVKSYNQFTVVPVMGDANHDGTVDLQDFSILKDNFGITSGATWEQGDFNNDGSVDLQDFSTLKENFGLDYR